ncbi:MAG: 4-(cytidine 5'-diphospho)-2-C-methyl-D-erythritol kinase [SAR324 cluster bacterium]|jgi:4-diphosphocytidyl-2-C-methyl-D-erythritol kinase|nr:4-(cytidine 5'-diphospho)-2-C-methyl-D-erythritol kinase [SAR324 cluster bacterium]
MMAEIGYRDKREPLSPESQVDIWSPAKINPVLQILRKRPDGFHDLFLHLVPISLYDRLSFTPQTSGGVRFQSTGRPVMVEPEYNLAVRAVRAFEQATQQTVHLKLHLEKHIPDGAGLGGGSSDAAAVLRVLNHLHGNRLSASMLHMLAVGLGADVPFFLDPQPCEATGRGEALCPLPDYPCLPLVVLKPPFSSSTAEAYDNCQPLEESPPHPPDSPQALEAMLCNRFELTLRNRFPELEVLKSKLRSVGAIGASVSGSGSAVFGIFEDVDTRDDAATQLHQTVDAEVFSCRMLTGPDAQHLFDSGPSGE